MINIFIFVIANSSEICSSTSKIIIYPNIIKRTQTSSYIGENGDKRFIIVQNI